MQLFRIGSQHESMGSKVYRHEKITDVVDDYWRRGWKAISPNTLKLNHLRERRDRRGDGLSLAYIFHLITNWSTRIQRPTPLECGIASNLLQEKWLRLGDTVRRLRTSVRVAAIGLLAPVYYVAAKLGLKLAFLHSSISPVWPAAGIAVAALLLLGIEVWPAIFIGAFVVNLTTAGNVATSLGISCGNTLEALAAAYLVNRFARGRYAFDRTQDILKFALLAGGVSACIGAIFGVTGLALGGFAAWSQYRAMWWTWWQGDAIGVIVVTPLLVLWSGTPRPRWNWDQIAEAAGLLGLLVIVSLAIFGGLFASIVRDEPVEFLCIPFLIWAAFRFGQREAATALAVLAGIAIWGTMHGHGPFVRQSHNESLLLLQAFMGVVVVMTLVLAAEVAERKRSMEKIQEMALSDPLTGLANYRRLVDVMDAEMKRFGRTGRPFSVLLLDLDGLKKINDTYGHVTGSRAICRLADILRVHCRGTDLAARYGGDEFAVVMPESEDDGARRAIRRISENIARDTEKPAISVSIGAALFPRDGVTIAELLEAADRSLYSKKNKSRAAVAR
jgi:diguanylate cyclase (GGDEF)-like protein